MKVIAKIEKNGVRNIHPKNSGCPYLNKYCSNRFKNYSNRFLCPIYIQKEVLVFFLTPATPLLAPRKPAGIALVCLC
jgi:hypothetical protein